jgi:hypothetical protein
MLIEVQVVEEFSFQSRFSAEISSDQKHRLAEPPDNPTITLLLEVTK